MRYYTDPTTYQNINNLTNGAPRPAVIGDGGSATGPAPFNTIVTNAGGSGPVWAASELAPNITTTHQLIHLIGKATSAGNSAYMGFNWTGNGNALNALNFGFYGKDNLFSILYSGKIGVNNTGPAALFDIIGTDTSSSTLSFSIANGTPTRLLGVYNDGGVYMLGKVGINNSMPAALLDVIGVDTSSSTLAFSVANNTPTRAFGIYDNGQIYMQGKVGVNNPGPAALLDIIGLDTSAASTSLAVGNSAPIRAFAVYNNLDVVIGTGVFQSSLSVTGGFAYLPFTNSSSGAGGIPTGTPANAALGPACVVNTVTGYLDCYWGAAWHKIAFSTGAG